MASLQRSEFQNHYQPTFHCELQYHSIFTRVKPSWHHCQHSCQCHRIVSGFSVTSDISIMALLPVSVLPLPSLHQCNRIIGNIGITVSLLAMESRHCYCLQYKSIIPVSVSFPVSILQHQNLHCSIVVGVSNIAPLSALASQCCYWQWHHGLVASITSSLPLSAPRHLNTNT